MDKPKRIGIHSYLRRCVPSRDAVAPWNYLFERAGDATAVTKRFAILREVVDTSELMRPTVGQLGPSRHQ